MKKNIVQDVLPPKKSIRNVRLSPKKEATKDIRSSTDRQARTEEAPEIQEDFSRPVRIQVPMRIEPIKNVDIKQNSNPDFAPYKYEFNEGKKKSKIWMYLSIILLILAISFGVSALFKSARIKISPKQDTKVLAENFVAKKDSLAGVSYQTVSVSKDVEKTVKATGEEKVDKKSQGKIIIYNNYNSQPQKLIATTRFQTPEGLIFRLISPVTIPGKETKNGKSVAGSIEVIVESDKPGVSYNIGLKDFTVPGFKGDPKYTTIYARSKTEMTGGFSGMQKTVSKDVLAQAETEMSASVKDALIGDIVAQIPANFLSYKEGLSYELEPISQVEATTKEDVVLRKRGKATAIIFDKSNITKNILNKVMPDVESEMVKISNLADLEFKINNSTATEVSFSLNGEANFVWVFDENKLKSDLLGLSKTSAKTVISTYPSINEAWIETKPFWNQKIPNDSKKVTLINTTNTE